MAQVSSRVAEAHGCTVGRGDSGSGLNAQQAITDLCNFASDVGLSSRSSTRACQRASRPGGSPPHRLRRPSRAWAGACVRSTTVVRAGPRCRRRQTWTSTCCVTRRPCTWRRLWKQGARGPAGRLGRPRRAAHALPAPRSSSGRFGKGGCARPSSRRERTSESSRRRRRWGAIGALVQILLAVGVVCARERTKGARFGEAQHPGPGPRAWVVRGRQSSATPRQVDGGGKGGRNSDSMRVAEFGGARVGLVLTTGPQWGGILC